MPAVFILSSQVSYSALIIALVGYLIVFTALLILYLIFKSLPGLIYYKRRNRKNEKSGVISNGSKHVIGEETAAIAMAIHLCLDEIHDEESGILTIKKVSKTYSPWSSKIYAVRNQFNRI